MKRVLLTALTMALVPGLVWSAKVKVWHHHAGENHQKAEFKQAVLTTEGSLRLARQVKPLADIDAAHVWALAEDAKGNLYVATGNDGKLLKVTPDGKVRVAYKSDDSQILCLAAAPDGTVYAGTGPSGHVIRIAPDGTSEVLWKSNESYVWSLAVDAKGQNLYAGTGPAGRIYQVARDGNARVFYTTKQDHVLCVALASDGQLYAGTDRHGLVYRIDPNGKGFVLLDAPQSEVRTLLVTPQGVYAGTSSPSSRRTPGVTLGSSVDSRAAAAPEVTPVKANAPDKPADNNDSKDSKDSKEKSAPPTTTGTNSSSGDTKSTAPTTSGPAAGENSVYRIYPDGTYREIFREKAMILALLQQQGRLLVATGGDGQLFEVREAEKEKTELVRLDHSQIHCLYLRQDGSVVLGTGDPGKLYLLENKYVAKGTVVSEVLDAKGLSRWGSLRWNADAPAGTQVSIAVRSGNVTDPDDTWSDWSAEETDPQRATAKAPPARFLQYRVTLAGSNPQVTPTLESLAIRYMTVNVAPEVSNVEVPDLDAVNLENPKKLKIKWTATDVNEDELTYSLHIRKEGWKNWVELEADFDKREYEWDTTTTPAGLYQIKVVASDRRENPDEQALTGERISSPFVVDHVPPLVTVKTIGLEGDQAILEANVNDGLSRLVSAAFSVDSRKWTNVFPTDGLFDSKSETFRFKTDALKPGIHVLVLRVTDASGNTGSSDVVFEVQVKK